MRDVFGETGNPEAHIIRSATSVLNLNSVVGAELMYFAVRHVNGLTDREELAILKTCRASLCIEETRVSGIEVLQK